MTKMMMRMKTEKKMTVRGVMMGMMMRTMMKMTKSGVWLVMVVDQDREQSLLGPGSDPLSG